MYRTYLDANATEPLRPEARGAVLAALDITGNPASVHAAGRAARQILENAREAVARRFGVEAETVVFTSGGTEANALAIHALGFGRRVLIGATEHEAVRAATPAATLVPVDGAGVIRLDTLAALLSEGGPALVCVMHANNETGTLQPLPMVREICQHHGALLHVDAVQAAGRLPFHAGLLGADSVALSSHKLGGPGGAGALLLGSTPREAVRPLIPGGGQERGWRGGTPGLPAIAGFAAATETAQGREGIAALRDRAENAALACGAVVLGAGAPRLPNTTCLALPGVPAQTQVIALDLAGINVSAGAACSSGKVARSHVLEAMGAGALAGEAIRVSLPWNVSEAAIEAFAAAYRSMASRLAGRAT